MSKPKLAAIVGPTASGKTSLGIALARELNGEIVSADSRQIYRGMDIGTAKPPRDPGSAADTYISGGIPHHLIDIRNPDEDYTVADFKRDATAAIDGIIARGRLPILVGGTGLYVRAVTENMDIPEVAADPELRRSIEADIAEHGLPAVFERLVALDPEAAYIVDPRNPRRVVRALEVATITGRPFTEQRRKNPPRYDVGMIGLAPAPEILRERIDHRIDDMMHAGLLDEVKNLLKEYRRADGTLPAAFDAIGYREIIDYFDGRTTLDGAVRDMKLNTWHFAKRQMTWFRKDKNIRWIENGTSSLNATLQYLSAWHQTALS